MSSSLALSHNFKAAAVTLFRWLSIAMNQTLHVNVIKWHEKIVTSNDNKYRSKTSFLRCGWKKIVTKNETTRLFIYLFCKLCTVVLFYKVLLSQSVMVGSHTPVFFFNVTYPLIFNLTHNRTTKYNIILPTHGFL